MTNTRSSQDWDDSYLRDTARLATLASTQLMDSEAEESFDRLTRLASSLVAAPVALISLVDANRQYFKSRFVFSESLTIGRQTPLSHSFCQHVVTGGRTLVIGDARLEPLVRDNPAIHEFGVIAYLGIPLTLDGHLIGSFCVIDDKPRDWTTAEIENLTDLADSVVAEIRLRRMEHREDESAPDRCQALRPLLSKFPCAVIATDSSGNIVLLNQEAEVLFGWTEALARGRPAEEILGIAAGLTRRHEERPDARVRLPRIVRLGALLRKRFAGSVRSSRSSYSLADALTTIGVTAHTLTTWERRYGFPIPTRSVLGRRRYDAEQVAVLSQIVNLASTGRTIGEMIHDYQLGILVL